MENLKKTLISLIIECIIGSICVVYLSNLPNFGALKLLFNNPQAFLISIALFLILVINIGFTLYFEVKLFQELLEGEFEENIKIIVITLIAALVMSIGLIIYCICLNILNIIFVAIMVILVTRFLTE